MSNNLRSRRAGTSKKEATNTYSTVPTSSSTSNPTFANKSHNTAAATMAPPSSSEADNPRTPLLGAKKSHPAHPAASLSERHASSSSSSSSSPTPPVPELKDSDEEERGGMENLSRKSQWIVLALASGACAAFNGVFAKLTTTELTTSFATAIANLIGLSNVEGGVEVVVRGLFFSLNLIFNGIMWTLFTKALARGTSTTQVSILNTSSNFMITAILGFLIFNEKLPGMWFVGAAMLVAGNVIIGRRDEGEEKEEGLQGRVEEGLIVEGEILLGGNEVELDGVEERGVKIGQEDEEDILDLGTSDYEDGDLRR